MFNKIIIKNVKLIAFKKVNNICIYKIYRITFDSGVSFSFLMSDDVFITQFIDDIQMYNYISINGFSYENN